MEPLRRMVSVRKIVAVTCMLQVAIYFSFPGQSPHRILSRRVYKPATKKQIPASTITRAMAARLGAAAPTARVNLTSSLDVKTINLSIPTNSTTTDPSKTQNPVQSKQPSPLPTPRPTPRPRRSNKSTALSNEISPNTTLPTATLVKTEKSLSNTTRLITKVKNLTKSTRRPAASSKTGKASMRVRVSTYNLLNPALATESMMPGCSKDSLKKENRLTRIFDKLSSEVDKRAVICLQEVPLQWLGEFHSFFQQHDYHLISSSDGGAFDDFMGSAIAVPNDQFICQNVKITRLADTITLPARVDPTNDQSLQKTKRTQPQSSANSSPSKRLKMSKDSAIAINTHEPHTTNKIKKSVSRSSLLSASLSSLRSVIPWVFGKKNDEDSINKETSIKQESEENIGVTFKEWMLAKKRNNKLVFVRLYNPVFKGTVCVGTYHLPCAYKNPGVLALHAVSASNWMHSMAEGDPIIFAGDLNIKPSDTAYKLISFPEQSLNKSVDSSLLTFRGRPWGEGGEPMTKGSLKSAYVSMTGKEPSFTTYSRIENRSVFISTLDYIFISPDIQVRRLLPLPSSRKQIRGPLPTSSEPSDHLMLAATVTVPVNNLLREEAAKRLSQVVSQTLISAENRHRARRRKQHRAVRPAAPPPRSPSIGAESLALPL